MVILPSAVALAAAIAAAQSVDAFIVVRPRSAASVPALTLRMSFRVDDEPPIDWSKYSPAAEQVEAPPPPPEVMDYPRAEEFAAVAPEDVLPPPPAEVGGAAEEEPIDWFNWAPSPIESETAHQAAAYEAAYGTPLPPPPPPVDVSVPEYSVQAVAATEQTTSPPDQAEEVDDHGWHFEPVDSSDYTSSRPYHGEAGETMDRAMRDSGEITYDQESNEIHEKIFTYALAVPFAAFLIGILNGIGLFGHH